MTPFLFAERLIGDPAYDATQHLFNCDRLHTGPKGLIKRMADLLELEYERVRLWTFARAAAEPRATWTADSLTVARVIGP